MKDAIDITRMNQEWKALESAISDLRICFEILIRKNGQLEERAFRLEERLAQEHQLPPQKVIHQAAPLLITQTELIRRWEISKSTFFLRRKSDNQFPKPAFSGTPVRYWIHEIESYEILRRHESRD